VAEIQSENPDIEQLVYSPRRMLAFRTFAYIRVGILLGSLLVERDVDSDEAATWADRLLRESDVREQVTAEIRAIAEEIAADPVYANDPRSARTTPSGRASATSQSAAWRPTPSRRWRL